MHKTTVMVLAAMSVASAFAIQGTLMTETETLTGEIGRAHV